MDSMERRYTPQGQGTYNTVAGSLGLASFLGLGANNNGCGNNGVLSGLFGNNNNNGGCCVTEKEFRWAEKYNECLAQNAKLSSENFSREAATKAFTDSVTYASGLNDKANQNFKELFNTVIAQGQEIAVLKSDIRCLSVTNDKDHEALRVDYTNKINLEAERRDCGDKNIVAWTTGELYKKANLAQYIDGSNVFCPDSNICGVATASTCKKG